MSPSITGLQKMVDICTEFSSSFHVKFNDSKSVCIALGNNNDVFRNIYMEGECLNWETQVKHLGNDLSTDLRDKCDIDYKKDAFIQVLIRLFQCLVPTK